MDQGQHRSLKQAEQVLLGDLLRRYRESVTPTKRGARDEAIRLRSLERDRLARYSLVQLSPSVVAEYRDRRLATCCPATVVRDLAVLSSIFNHARREWNLGVSNPVADVRKPPVGPGRERVLSLDEEARLLAHAKPLGRRNPLLLPLLQLALATGMRKGELLSLRWTDVHLDRAIAKLRVTKNGSPRCVPLSTLTVQVLKLVPTSECGMVFPLSVASLDQMFRRLRARAGVDDLRFHDLRHTATTRLAEKLPNVIELAAVTGHKSLQMLKRYYHPSAEDLAQKLG